MSFHCHFAAFSFSLIQECYFADHFVRFYHFRQSYHTLILSSKYVIIRADSEEISTESALLSAENLTFQS